MEPQRSLRLAREDVSERQRRYGLHADALILHCPGPERDSSVVGGEWDAACREFFAGIDLRGKFTDRDDLTIITYNTRPQPGLLEVCLAHLGLSDLVVLGRGLTDWKWSYKVQLVHDYLQSGACRSEHILCLDGDDVLVIGDPGLALRRFVEMECEMLFCNTRGDWPPSPECAAFEDEVAREAAPTHRHLNAGGYFARAAYAAARLGEIVAGMQQEASWCTAEHGFDDQLAWRHLHRRYFPAIRVDARCRVFLRFDDDR